MIRFLLKGLLRDRSRFLFPIITVTLGVMLTVLLHSWIGGLMMDFIDASAKFSTGHVRIITKSYADNEDQMPNDLALLGITGMLDQLREKYPQMTWAPRIHFSGLLDIPDSLGDTSSQGPMAAMAIDLLTNGGHTLEKSRLQIENALVRGRMPRQRGEILISDEFACKLRVLPGGTATILTSTMNGSMAMQNFVIAGTLRFGVPVMDKAALIVDLVDAQVALDMNDAAGEILGYLPGHVYDDKRAQSVAQAFNSEQKTLDDFTPIMLTLRQQNGLEEYLQMVDQFSGILVGIFIVAMSIVLWNAGLLGGLRRYGEVGLRLAIGEHRGHIYRSMIMESIFIGLAGSILGTVVGLTVIYSLHVHGVDLSSFMQNSSLVFSNIVRPSITAQSYYLGFIPGLFATVLGAMLAGIGIYRRSTAQLFKELEI